MHYENLVLEGDLRLDLLTEGVLVVELKAVENLLALHEAQLLTYMRLAGVRTGLLINFNSRSIKDGLKRLVL